MKTALVCLVIALCVTWALGSIPAGAFESPISPIPEPVFEDDTENTNNDQHETPEPRPERGTPPPAYPDDFQPAPADPDMECDGNVDEGTVTCHNAD